MREGEIDRQLLRSEMEELWRKNQELSNRLQREDWGGKILSLGQRLENLSNELGRRDEATGENFRLLRREIHDLSQEIASSRQGNDNLQMRVMELEERWNKRFSDYNREVQDKLFEMQRMQQEGNYRQQEKIDQLKHEWNICQTMQREQWHQMQTEMQASQESRRFLQERLENFTKKFREELDRVDSYNDSRVSELAQDLERFKNSLRSQRMQEREFDFSELDRRMNQEIDRRINLRCRELQMSQGMSCEEALRIRQDMDQLKSALYAMESQGSADRKYVKDRFAQMQENWDIKMNEIRSKSDQDNEFLRQQISHERELNKKRDLQTNERISQMQQNLIQRISSLNEEFMKVLYSRREPNDQKYQELLTEFAQLKKEIAQCEKPEFFFQHLRSMKESVIQNMKSDINEARREFQMALGKEGMKFHQQEARLNEQMQIFHQQRACLKEQEDLSRRLEERIAFFERFDMDLTPLRMMMLDFQEEMRQRVTSLETWRNKIDERVQSCEKRIEECVDLRGRLLRGMEEKANLLDFHKHLQKFKQVEDEVNLLSSQGAPFSKEARQELELAKQAIHEESKERIENLQQQFYFLQKKHHSMGEQYDFMGQQYHSMEQENQKRKEEIQNLQVSYQKLLQKVKSLGEIDQRAIYQAEELKSLWQKMQQEIDSLRQDISKMDSKFEKKFEDFGSRVGRVENQAGVDRKNFQKRFQEVELQVRQCEKNLQEGKGDFPQFKQEMLLLKDEMLKLKQSFENLQGIPRKVENLEERVKQLDSLNQHEFLQMQSSVLGRQQLILQMIEDFLQRMDRSRAMGRQSQEEMLRVFMEDVHRALGGGYERGDLDFSQLARRLNQWELESLKEFMGFLQARIALAGEVANSWGREGDFRERVQGRELPTEEGRFVENAFFDLGRISFQVSQDSFSKKILERCAESDENVSDVIEERLQELSKIEVQIKKCEEMLSQKQEVDQFGMGGIREAMYQICGRISREITKTREALILVQTQIAQLPKNSFEEGSGIFDLHLMPVGPAEGLAKYENRLMLLKQEFRSQANPDYSRLLEFSLEQKERRKFERNTYLQQLEENSDLQQLEENSEIGRQVPPRLKSGFLQEEHLTPDQVSNALGEMKQHRVQTLGELPFISRWDLLTDERIAFRIEPLIRALASGRADRDTALELHRRVQRVLWDQGIREYLPPIEEIILFALQDLYCPNSNMLRDRMGRKYGKEKGKWQQTRDLSRAHKFRAKMISECERALKNLQKGNEQQEEERMDSVLEKTQKFFQESIYKMSANQEILLAFSRGNIFNDRWVDPSSVLGSTFKDYQFQRNGAFVGQRENQWQFQWDGEQAVCHRGNPLEVFIVHPAGLLGVDGALGDCVPLMDLSTKETFLLKRTPQGMALIPVLEFKTFSQGDRAAFEGPVEVAPPRAFESRFKGFEKPRPTEVYRLKQSELNALHLGNPSNLSDSPKIQKEMGEYNEKKMERFAQRVVPNFSRKSSTQGQRDSWKSWTEKSIEKHLNMLIYEKKYWRSKVAFERLRERPPEEGLFNQEDQLCFAQFILPQGEGVDFSSPVRSSMQKYLEHEHRQRAYERVLQKMEGMEASEENCQEIADMLGSIETPSLDMRLAENRMALLYQSVIGNTLREEQIAYLRKAQAYIEQGRVDLAMLILAGTGFGKTEIVNLLAMLFLAHGEPRVCCSTVSSNMGTLMRRMSPLGKAMGSLPVFLDFESISPMEIMDPMRAERFMEELRSSSIVCISDRGRLILSHLALKYPDIWGNLHQEISRTQQICDEVDSQCMSLEEEEDMVVAEILTQLEGEMVDPNYVKELRLTEMLNFQKSLVGCSATCSTYLGMALSKTRSKEELEQATGRDILTGEHRVENWLAKQATLTTYPFSIENALDQLSHKYGNWRYNVLFSDDNNEISGILPEDNQEQRREIYNEKKEEAARKLSFQLKTRGQDQEVWFQAKERGGVKKWKKISHPEGEATDVGGLDMERAERSAGKGRSYFYSKDDIIGTHAEQSSKNEKEGYAGHILVTDLKDTKREGELHPFLKMQQLLGRANRTQYSMQDMLLYSVTEDKKETLRLLRAAQERVDLENKPLIFRCYMRGVFRNMAVETERRVRALNLGPANAQIENQLRQEIIEDLNYLRRVLPGGSLQGNVDPGMARFLGPQGVLPLRRQRDIIQGNFHNTIDIDQLFAHYGVRRREAVGRGRYEEEDKQLVRRELDRLYNEIQNLSYQEIRALPAFQNARYGGFLRYERNRQAQLQRIRREFEQQKVRQWQEAREQFNKDLLALEAMSKELDAGQRARGVRVEQIMEEASQNLPNIRGGVLDEMNQLGAGILQAH